ncbi:hypothetical protein HDV03_002671 [Kappamyces sp. JEL0829]|nr:hypothetical protein HDV03_002671 [Kappamyces sp. JEL0829]
MKRIQAFPFKALQQNLGIGRGSNVTLPPYLKSIRVYFGSETCPSMGPFSSFYVNELPRLFASNPDLVISLDQEGDNGGSGHCSITLSPGNLQVDFQDCTSAGQIYDKVMDHIARLEHH